MCEKKQDHQVYETKLIIAFQGILRNTLALFTCYNSPVKYATHFCRCFDFQPFSTISV